MITYLCKYTPLELLAACGAELEEPNTDVEDFRNADALIHTSVCTHAKMLLEGILAENSSADADPQDSGMDHESADDQSHAAPGSPAPDKRRELLLTNCCDSVRRVYDTAPGEAFSFKEMLDLPHTSDETAVRLYASRLIKLRDDYIRRTGGEFRRDVLIRKWKENADRFEALKDQGNFIAILGARVSDQLRTKIRDMLPFPVIDLTCGGLRPIPQPPKEVFVDVTAETGECCGCEVSSKGGSSSAEMHVGDKPTESDLSDRTSGFCAANSQFYTKGGGLTDEGLITAYARALLTQVPCTRMANISVRENLLRHPALKGVVYHSVKFCDYYSYEYASIRRSSELPMLKIESDYTSQSEGQLDTRIAAFAESINENEPEENTKSKDSHKRSDFNGTDNKNMKNIYIGIDSGSTSTNVAAIDGDGRLVAWTIVRTGARAGTAAENAIEEVKKQLGADASCIRRVIATGYGREFITFADKTKTEISCHARGAHFADPSARTIIDIGGQDSKVICLDEDGNVMNFVMNDKCAAGTGRFLEMMAQTLELNMDELGRRGLRWKKDLTISSTCTVFAESEVVGLIAENTETDDIIHALNKSVASRTCGMVKRVRGEGPYMMTGGVAKNAGVAKEIERRLGAKLAIMEHPDLIGAIGAALFARG